MRRTKASTLTHFAGAACAIAALTTMSGCLNHPLKPVEYDKSQELERTIDLVVNKDVDILFVIDNSGSMGEEQAKLAANFGAFIDVLEDPTVKANYRIGVTTTDNGNPWCGGTTSPEAGELVFQSCRNRLNEFTSLDGQNNQEQEACLDVCAFEDGEIDHIGTPTEVDESLTPRPWIENIEGLTNVSADGAGIPEIFACYGPQGIKGCGFESHLESMWKSLQRMQSSNEDSYGFLRESAILSIIHVTDEADCSYVNEYDTIFADDGNRVFWSDPDANFPTSAVCWNAGVECTGDPSNYDECHSSNKDVDGNVDVDDSDAVLHPLSRYYSQIRGLESQKQMLNPNQEVIVGLIGGVASDGQPSYGDATNTNPTFQNDFGIGPGCTSPPDQEAVPPVRLAEFTNEFSADNMHSVCEDDYTSALEAIADRIREQIVPACYTECVKDDDPSTEVLDPVCTVEQIVPGDEDGETLDECARDGNGDYRFEDNDYVQPSDDVNVCYAVLLDSDGSFTGDPNDNMSPDPADDSQIFCAEQGYNLEFRIARRQGFPAAGGTQITAACSLSDFPQVDCPDN